MQYIVNRESFQIRAKVSLFDKHKHNLQSYIVRLETPSSRAIASLRCVRGRRGLSCQKLNERFYNIEG